MRYGYDIDQSGKSLCSIRALPELSVYAGILLYAFGPPVPQNAVLDVGKEKALQMAQRTIQATIEKILLTNGTRDLKYAAFKISEAIQECNRVLYELSSFLGQGIYLGGAVAYIADAQYIIFPFGGGRVYTWNGLTFLRQGDNPEPDGVTRDAIGSAKLWSGQCWTGTIPNNSYLILTSDLLADNPTKELREVAATGHSDTPAMLIRSSLKHSSDQSAVVYFQNRTV